MNPKLLPSATFINNVGVSNRRHTLLNILQLNGGAMSVEELMRENTDPHEVTVYTITDFLRDGLLAPELAPGDRPRDGDASEDPALDFRFAPGKRVRLTDSGRLALEDSA